MRSSNERTPHRCWPICTGEIQLVIAMDHDEHRFRCHHLLLEELSADLLTFESAQIPVLHERACRWFDAHGDREARHPARDGIRRHGPRGGDDLAGRSAMRGVWATWTASTSGSRGLSDAQIASNRWLSMAATWAALQQGDAVAMGRWALTADAHAGPHWREAASSDPYAATVAVLHALVGLRRSRGHQGPVRSSDGWAGPRRQLPGGGGLQPRYRTDPAARPRRRGREPDRGGSTGRFARRPRHRGQREVVDGAARHRRGGARARYSPDLGGRRGHSRDTTSTAWRREP